jgi:hypothetical protein
VHELRRDQRLLVRATIGALDGHRPGGYTAMTTHQPVVTAGLGTRGAAARHKLTASSAFARLVAAGHDLAAGAVLTSVSTIPFEMSFKCTRCGSIFWFENLSWREGGFDEWYSSADDQECAEAERMRRRATLRMFWMHP